jgi:hypothetical protein
LSTNSAQTVIGILTIRRNDSKVSVVVDGCHLLKLFVEVTRIILYNAEPVYPEKIHSH